MRITSHFPRAAAWSAVLLCGVTVMVSMALFSEPRVSDADCRTQAHSSQLAEAAASTRESDVRERTAPAEESERIFSPDRVHTFTLCMSAADWDDLHTHALDKEYRKAGLFVDGEWIGHVGLRYKGYDSLRLCFENGVQICPKASMRLTFNEYRRRGRFTTLEGLHLNAMASDPTLMREQIAYRLYRQMGVSAPRTSYARVAVNDRDLGLFTVVEPIDERFIKVHFPRRARGNLYKELWPTNSNQQRIFESLRTHKRAANIGAVLDFSSDLHHAPSEELPAVVAMWMDVNQTMRFLALDRTIANWDGITTLYCDEQRRCGNHNFYLYEDHRHRFTLLPWDLEAAFDLVNALDDLPEWNEEPGDCSQRYYNQSVQAAGCDQLIRALALTDRKRYHDALALLAKGPFQLPALYEYIDELARVIEPHVATDSFGPSPEHWRASVAALKGDLVTLRQRLEALAAGERPERAWLAVLGVNDWEAVSPAAAVVGLESHVALPSVFHHRINELEPLGGKRDLRLEFEFRNGEDPWQQWGFVRIPFRDGVSDVRAVTKLRLLMRSDQQRTVRVSLDSDRYTKKHEGALWGWEVRVGVRPTRVILSFDDLAAPGWIPLIPETREEIRASSSALRIAPLAVGVDTGTGLFPEGVDDKGFVQIDEIEFLP